MVQSKDVAAGRTRGLVLLPGILDRWSRARDYLPEFQEGPVPDWHTQWWSWVRQFTMRRLTNNNDRAYAMLGLAEYLLTCDAFENVPNRRYLMGLWESNLVSGLLWFVTIGAKERPHNYRAPSWSWVSVDGGIDNRSVSAGYNSGLEVERVNAVKDGPSENSDDTLQIVPRLAKSSYIQVRGKIRELKWRTGEKHFYYQSDTQGLDAFDIETLQSNAALGLLPSASTRKVGPRCYPLFVDSIEECVGWIVPDTSDVLNPDETLHCLQIIVEPEQDVKRQDFRESWVMRGIVLRPISPEDQGSNDESVKAYERVGFFELEKQSTGVYLPVDAYRLLNLRRYVFRTPPDVDPYGVFRDCEPESIRIY